MGGNSVEFTLQEAMGVVALKRVAVPPAAKRMLACTTRGWPSGTKPEAPVQ